MRTQDIEGVIMYDDNDLIQGHDISWYVHRFLNEESIDLLEEDVGNDKNIITFKCNKLVNGFSNKFTICLEHNAKETTISLSYPSGNMNMYPIQGKFKKKFTCIGFSVKEYYIPF